MTQRKNSTVDSKILEVTVADLDLEAAQHIQEQIENSHKLLLLLIEIYGQKGVAERLAELNLRHAPDRETLNRWKKNPKKNPISFDDRSQEIIRKALLPEKPEHYNNPAFRFIDLFAGIGGIRKGFDEIGGQCVFTSEWNNYSRKTYLANHYVGEDELDYFLNPADGQHRKHQGMMDIQSITLSQKENVTEEEVTDNINRHIPDHEVLLAGFPCQPFSLAGVSKKNSLGRAHGFECETQGTLFFDVEKILEVKRPKFFVLENVKNLKNHDKGNTFAVIVRALHRQGYWLADISDEGLTENGIDIETAIQKVRKRTSEPVIIDGKQYLPQHRERVVLVGVRNDINHEGLSLRNIMPAAQVPSLNQVLLNDVDPKYTLTEHLWNYLFHYALKHQKKGNGLGFGLVDPANENSVTRTLSARYHKDGSEILIDHLGLTHEELQEDNFDKSHKTPRRLMPRECARLMGFEKLESERLENDKDFIIPVSDTQAYRQFGNSVVVPVFRSVAQLLLPYLTETVAQDQDAAEVA
jgi:DNA (cytosine-5)-methyltransferase 1